MSPKGTPLTDEQDAAIAWADPSASTASLSRRLGVDPRTVSANRRRIARVAGWWCELVLLTCLECGRPFLAGTGVRSVKRRHPACQHINAQVLQREYHRRLMQECRHERTLAVMRETYQRDLAHTGAYPFRDDVAWTPEEDARLLATMDRPVQELVEELGRSPASIDMRRMRLRRQATETPTRPTHRRAVVLLPFAAVETAE